MKVFLALIIYIFSSIFSICSAKIVEVDKIIAVVNNQVILSSDLNQVLFYLKQEKNIITVPLKINFLKDKILEKLITDTIILEEANRFNITVSDAQVDIMLNNIASKKHITLNQLKKSIILNNTNDFFNYEDYIKYIKKSLKIKILEDYILHNKVRVSEDEIYYLLNKKIKQQNELKKVDLNFIILPFSNKESDKIIKQKKLLINNITEIIHNNSNFDFFYDNFKKNNNLFLSENTSLKSLKKINTLFLNKLNIFKKNQILGPILGKKGFYIIKVNDIKDNNSKKIITEFHIEHCFIHPSATLTDIQAKKNIFKIYNNIKRKNYNFEYAVEHFSHDINSSYKQGDLGWILNQSFDGAFKNILQKLHPNQLSKPIKSKFGWHIIKLLEKRRTNGKWKIEKEKIYQFLLKREIQKEKNNWIKTLKKSFYINKY